MRVFAIADLHLPGNNDKTMDRFGENWVGHFLHIQKDWQQRVTQEDVVLLPGDISWAMQWEDACADLSSLDALPGKKVLLRGNHDYWWASPTKMREAGFSNLLFLQNNAIDLGNFVLAGTRGWTVPVSKDNGQDIKIYQRELIRLELSLKDAQKAQKPIVAMMHFPPFDENKQGSGFTDLMEKYQVRTVVYGHLHGYSVKGAINGIYQSVSYHLVSCDSLKFKLWEVSDFL